MNHERINVTKSFLPPLSEYEAYLRDIWKRGWLTNQGPLLHELESSLRTYLGVSNVHFVSNGTIALQIALRALDITEGEIITTPFSYVASTSAIMWEGCVPVYVDIREDTLCIDADKIEEAITSKTRAILAVHVFGQPCDVEKIAKIAKKYNLKVIYDGAHAFGVTYKGKSLLDYGDISTCSFHSTKLFHTIEGGAVVVKGKEINDRVELIKRFGHDGDNHYMLGINAKSSEFQAAMGLTNLRYIDDIIQKRKKIHEQYDDFLPSDLPKFLIQPVVNHNYSYYPVIFKNEEVLLNTIAQLNKENVFPRRYFYPSLNTLPYVPGPQPCPISENIASRILCLPFYQDLASDDVHRIINVIQNTHVA